MKFLSQNHNSKLSKFFQVMTKIKREIYESNTSRTWTSKYKDQKISFLSLWANIKYTQEKENSRTVMMKTMNYHKMNKNYFFARIKY